MDKLFVTTFNKRLYREYAHRLIGTYTATNQTTKMVCYVEDDLKYYPKHTQIEFRNLFEEEPELKNFRDRNHTRPVKGFIEDAVRFSYKVFAQRAATRLDAKKIFYVDSDCVFDKKIPDSWFDKVLPEGNFLAFYDRPNYTETGFLAFDNSLEYSKTFFDRYVEWYIKDTIYTLEAYTDCHTLDATRNYMKEFVPNYKERALGDGKLTHIMARDPLMNEYIDHRKGDRKRQNNSPEWVMERRG